jgi:hypothetical protein
VRTTRLDHNLWDDPGITFASTSASTPTVRSPLHIGDYDLVIAMDRKLMDIFRRAIFRTRRISSLAMSSAFRELVDAQALRGCGDDNGGGSFDRSVLLRRQRGGPAADRVLQTSVPLTCSGQRDRYGKYLQYLPVAVDHQRHVVQ